MQAAKQFGGKLFDAVFSSDVRGALRSSIETANREDAGLRVRLRLADAPELVDLPWEFLYNSTLNRFLALSNKTPLVRYIDLPETPRPLKISPPLRVLVMISSPSDYEALDVEREWQKLNDAVRDLSANNMVLLERLDAANLGALRRKLRQAEYHVLHFIGHGGFDAQAQDGVLLLEDEQKRGRKTSGQYLAQVLTDHKSLRLVVLNACEGGRTARNDPIAGVAQSLVQQGMSAVIAMQFEVTDEASITFAQEFYAALSDGYPVDAALGEARGAIFSDVNDLEWGTPVLYLRAPDGMIFAPLSEQERAERERARLAEEQRARDKQQQIETLALATQTNFDKHDFDAAEKSLATLLALDATNANARELQSKIQAAREQQVREQAAEQERLAQEQRVWEQEARERQHQIEKLYADAQTSFDRSDFDAAEKSLAALLALDPTNANARELQTKLQAAREQQARELVAEQERLAQEQRLREQQEHEQLARKQVAQTTRTVPPNAMPERAAAKPPPHKDVPAERLSTSPSNTSKGHTTRNVLILGTVIVIGGLLSCCGWVWSVLNSQQHNPATIAQNTPVPTLQIFAQPTAVPSLGAATKPAQTGAIEKRGTDNAPMVFVPAGEFLMGSGNNDPDAQSDEMPQHTVYLDAFWIDQHEVTNAQYAHCVTAKRCIAPSERKSNTRYMYYLITQFDNYPVIYVSWDDANTYCKWAGKRLPTEAEWEKAARGTDKRIYPWGNTFEAKNINSVASGEGDTTEVGAYSSGASPYGAYDMGGNVWEWVNDRYAKNYYGITPKQNPQGPSSSSSRVLRGGSWNYGQDIVRVAYRNEFAPGSRFFDIGFRCAQ